MSTRQKTDSTAVPAARAEWRHATWVGSHVGPRGPAYMLFTSG